MKGHLLSERCGPWVSGALREVEIRARRGDRALAAGRRAEAKAAYKSAHGLLRQAIGTIRGCSVLGKVQAPRKVLRALAVAADEFERFEQHLEG